MRSPTTSALPFLLFTLLSLIASVLSIGVEPGVDPKTVAHLPYQYFLEDFFGGNSAVCWLSPNKFPEIEGIECNFATTVSQVRGRQTWQCKGSKDKFCEGCGMLARNLSDSRDIVNWRVQGC